jgi:hypothetical protein
MKRYTVTCEHHRTYYNVVTVEADSIEEACQKAADEVSVAAVWDDYDDVGDTYVGHIREAHDDEAVPDESGAFDPFDNHGPRIGDGLTVPDDWDESSMYLRGSPVAEALSVVLSYAGNYADDWADGLRDGTYDDREGLADLNIAIERGEALLVEVGAMPGPANRPAEAEAAS